MNVRFEHIAIAVHEEDYPAWDRLLRFGLGGSEGMGGEAGALGFRGTQVPYSCGGMLELISWSLPMKPDSAIAQYVKRFGPRAALHHLTFLVDSIDAARDRCSELGYEFMQGRDQKHWKEIYLRAPFFEPPKMLIQLLEADKEKMRQAAGDAVSVTRGGPDAGATGPASRIVGARLACSDGDGARSAEKLFCDLLEATAQGDVLTWKNSSMQIELMPGAVSGDSCVAIETAVDHHPMTDGGAPSEALRLIRNIGDAAPVPVRPIRPPED